MSVVKDVRDLILGNGDLFLADTVAALPGATAYKNARAAGTLPVLAGNAGAIKGTVNLQIVRETIKFEIGVPQETADMTVIREGIMLKCSLSELSLATVKRQIGGGIYATVTAGAQHFTGTGATALAITAQADANTGEPISYVFPHPILLTDSVPVAAANPVVKDAAEGVTYTKGTDYIFDTVNNTFTWLEAGGINAGDIVHVTSYYWNQLTSETLTMGGQADVTQSAVRFFHPYKDGRVLMFTGYKMSPTGTVTLPMEEIAYSNSEFELTGIADFTKGAGNHLFELYRELAA